MFGSFQLFSQVNIILQNGDNISARKIFPASKRFPGVVRYKSQSGTITEIKPNTIFCVTRRKDISVYLDNGGIQLGRVLKDHPDMSPKDSCSKAIIDAIKTYIPKPAGQWITCTVACLAWPVGLIPAIIFSSATPAESELNIPKDKINDKTYTDCYRNEAAKKKSSTIWRAWGSGTACGLAIAAALMNAATIQ